MDLYLGFRAASQVATPKHRSVRTNYIIGHEFQRNLVPVLELKSEFQRKELASVDKIR
jgi:hypothetical protein